MTLSSISVPLLGMVDTAVMGHLGDAGYMGAVAAGSMIFSFLFMGLNFLRMGTTGITAQAHGAGNSNAMRAGLGQPFVMALLLAGLLILLQKPIMLAALTLIAPSTAVGELTGEYFRLRIWSSPAVLCNFVIVGWLLGMQKAREPLVITLTINLCNIVLDLWLVIGLGMKVEGVAIASVIAEMLGLVVGLTFVAQELARHEGHWNWTNILEPGRYRRLFSINSNLLLRTLALMFTFAFITAQGARMGDVILAANALLINFQYFLAYALDGIALAAEALTGKAIGSKNNAGFKEAVWRTLRWSLVFAAGFTGIYYIAGTAIIDLQTNIPSVQETARAYLPWLIASPLISVWSFFYDGVFAGTTRSREMRIVMIASVLLVFLPVWYIFRDTGNQALWLAFMSFMVARGAAMHIWYRHLLHTNAFLPTTNNGPRHP